MTAERRRDQMTEKELGPQTPDVQTFLTEGLGSQGELFGRHAIGQTPVPPVEVANYSDLQVASLLSEVAIDDPYLGQRVKAAVEAGLKKEEDLALAAEVVVGKVHAMQEGAPKEVRGRFGKFKDDILRATVEKVAHIKGKKALSLALVPLVAAACSSPVAEGSLQRPIEGTYTPTPTEAGGETLMVERIEEAAQNLAGLDVEVTSVVGGTLSTPNGERFSLASSVWHQPDREDMDLPLLVLMSQSGEISGVFGLAYDENSQDTLFDLFAGFTFSAEDNSVNLREESIRLERTTDSMEVFIDGSWVLLSGQTNIQTEMADKLRGRLAPTTAEVTPTPEAVQGEWRTEVVGSHGTVMRLVIGEEVWGRLPGFQGVQFVDTDFLDEYWGGQEGFVEDYLRRYAGDGVTPEIAQETASLLWEAFPEGRAIDNLELAFLRAVYERGREVGLFSNMNFDSYVRAVEQAHESGDSSGVAAPLTEGRVIDPTKPVTFAFIDPDTTDERGGLVHVGSSTDEWVDYVYFLNGSLNPGIPGHDPLGQWKRRRWQIGFDNEGGAVFADVLDERFYRAAFGMAGRGDTHQFEILLARSITRGFQSIQRDRFLNTSGIAGGEVPELDMGNVRGSDFFSDMMEISLARSGEGGRTLYFIFQLMTSRPSN